MPAAKSNVLQFVTTTGKQAPAAKAQPAEKERLRAIRSTLTSSVEKLGATTERLKQERALWEAEFGRDDDAVD